MPDFYDAKIREQLQRIIASERFSAAHSQAELLAFVVDAALSGQNMTEDQIGTKLLPGFTPDDSSNIRVTARNLRKRLQEYYENEGKDDSFIISFPNPQRTKKLNCRPARLTCPSLNQTLDTQENGIFKSHNTSCLPACHPKQQRP